MAKCNHDCFNCKFDDCINDVITKTEKMESIQRDKNYTSYGRVVHAKVRASLDKGRRH